MKLCDCIFFLRNLDFSFKLCAALPPSFGQKAPLLRSGEKGAAGIIYPAARTMKNSIPAGFTKAQWSAITEGLRKQSGTINDYRKVINLLSKHYQGSIRIDSITKEEAENYFKTLDLKVKEGNLSPNTAHRYKATLRSIASRMQKHPELWPSYENPFKGLLGEEERRKTTYTKETFAGKENLLKIHQIMNELSTEEQIILRLMMFAGLSPAQIQALKVNSFFINEKNQYEMMSDLGTVIEHTDLPWRQSPYYRNLPVHYVSHSASHTITWRYTGTFCFSQNMMDLLKRYYPYTGQSKDDRAYFLTQRHQEYSYRAIHRLVNQACLKAGLVSGIVTPRQLSLHGMLYSWNIMQNHRISNTGVWKNRYPDPMQNQINRILKQLTEKEIDALIIKEG